MPNLKFKHWIQYNVLHQDLIWFFSFYFIIVRHGRNKFNAGAGLAVLGLLTGNAGITSLGTNLAGLGLKTKVAAHLFPSHGK